MLEKEEISLLYRQCEPSITQAAIDRRINRLVKLAYIGRVERGKYVLAGHRQAFSPNIPEPFKDLYASLKGVFPFMQACLWSTGVYASLMQHIPRASYRVIEVDRDSCKPAFHWMVSEGYMAILSPDQDFLDDYQHLLQGDPWVVQPLTTESPLLKVNGLPTASLEKLLVDMFSKDGILNFLQGAERSIVFQNAFDRYIVNRSALMRYARRRGVSHAVAAALRQTNEPLQYDC